jgi:hypothetical protein
VYCVKELVNVITRYNGKVVCKAKNPLLKRILPITYKQKRMSYEMKMKGTSNVKTKKI